MGGREKNKTKAGNKKKEKQMKNEMLARRRVTYKHYIRIAEYGWFLSLLFFFSRSKRRGKAHFVPQYMCICQYN